MYRRRILMAIHTIITNPTLHAGGPMLTRVPLGFVAAAS